MEEDEEDVDIREEDEGAGISWIAMRGRRTRRQRRGWGDRMRRHIATAPRLRSLHALLLRGLRRGGCAVDRRPRVDHPALYSCMRSQRSVPRRLHSGRHMVRAREKRQRAGSLRVCTISMGALGRSRRQPDQGWIRCDAGGAMLVVQGSMPACVRYSTRPPMRRAPKKGHFLAAASDG